MKPKQATHPRVEWNGEVISVTLPYKGQVIRAKWKPGVLFMVRIREAGAAEWSPGFQTPFATCQFTGLKSDTEYECEVRPKNAVGEGEPTQLRFRTGPEGAMAIDNSIPELPTQ